MPERRRNAPIVGRIAVVAVVLILLLAMPSPVRAAPYPPLPIGDGAILLGNLSGPVLAPGASGKISFSVVDPLTASLAGATLTLAVYAFNAFPGNATSTVPVSGAPLLSNATSSAAQVTVPVGALAPGARYVGQVGVATSSTTPVGAFAVRTELDFTANGTAYRLQSRGWFTAGQWAAATQGSNGTATLNLSVLGVSGVLPETSVVVASSTFPWILAGLAAGGTILVGLGAWFYFRRTSSSRSGTRKGADDQ